MDLKGEKILHKVFGEGLVKGQKDGYIRIQFKAGEKEFPFPGAFEQFLSPVDEGLTAGLNKLLKAEAKEQAQQEAEDQARIEQTRRRLAAGQRAGRAGARASDNIAFKCTYCDGGSGPDRVGFLGVCSDRNIRQNIRRDKRVWCSDETCACRHYLDGGIDRIALEAEFKERGSVCYESALLRDWTYYSGMVQSGPRRGQPMGMKRLNPGSLCALTTRLPGTREDERQVFAVFLVAESYEGDGTESGFVAAQEEYRLELSPEEAASLPFWRYHRNSSQPEKALWSSGLHRYFGTRQAALMLRDIARLKEGKQDGQLAQELYSHYCQLHQVDEASLGEPEGALTLQ